MDDSGQKREVEGEDWYHGVITRKEAETRLKSAGAWLGRATEVNGKTRLVVSVHAEDGQVRHLVVHKDKKGYFVDLQRYPSPLLLVEHHIRTQEPISRSIQGFLREPVKKVKRKYEIPKRDVTLTTWLGEGQFGEVWAGEVKIKEQTYPVAVKTLKASAGGMTNELKEEFKREANIMLRYKHPNLVSLIGVVIDLPPLMLILENCPGGSLDSFLKKNVGVTTVPDKIRYCLEAASGMEYLAEKKQCVHRDLAARNCLVGVGDIIKIADFGLTRTGTYTMAGNRLVPIKWTAPEALKTATFTKASDVWSFGVLMWEIFMDAKELPWDDLPTAREAYRAVKSGQQMKTPPDMPAQMENIMRSCWHLAAGERPNMTMLREKIQEAKNPSDRDSPDKTPSTRTAPA